MLSASNRVTVFLVAFVLSVAGWAAHAQSAPAPAPAQQSTLRGHVTDPTGALIPGAQIIIATAQGAPVSKLTADAAGAYAARGLAAGSYVIQVEFQGFAPFVSKPISLEAGQVKNVDIKMAVEAEQQQVEVTAEGSPTVSTEAGANTSAIVLKDKDLDALSDDPDELSNELQALAGPSAGPNGGQIYIDGFTGGQLPPKSAIREIRINQNPFSAEFDRLGYGRIEILTKPGTDQLHGRGFLMGNDDTFNTGNPFTKNIPAYHSIQGEGTLSGALSKTASFFISVEQRNNQDASIYNAVGPVLSNGTYVSEPMTGGLFAPQTRTEISPRIDLQLGQKNTLTLRYFFWRNSSTGSIGTTSLPTQNSSAETLENSIQISDSEIISDRIVNEFRFQYRRSTNWEHPDSITPTINVPGYISEGGDSSQSQSGHSDHLELQEFVTMTQGAHAIKFGAWMRDNRQATSTSSGFNGTFNFPTLQAYLDTLNGMAQGQTVSDIAANCPVDQQNAGGCTPNKLSYTTGPYSFVGNLYDTALFVQDDWKYNRFLTLSGGLRWESQNHISDHSDFAPRVAFAYALDGHHNNKQKTVLRGGFGFFYDRFQISDLMNLEQYNGTSGQTQTVISSPTCFDSSDVKKALTQGCTGSASTTSTPQIEAITPRYHSPYAEPAGVSIERQLTKAATLTATYLHYFGVHQMVVRDANAFEPGSYQYGTTLTGTRPTSYPGIIDEYFPEAVFKQNQFILNINAQFSRNLGITGFYNLTNAKSDGGGESNPSNSNNIQQDYGRAGFIHPQVLFLMANYTGPWGITFNPFLFAQAGKPYSATTANDLTGDNFFNNRPALADASNCAQTTAVSAYVTTPLGCLNTDPANDANMLPINTLNAPANFTMNLRISRSFGLGPSTESSGDSAQHGGPGGGPGGGHGSHGMGGFGGPFGGGGGFHGGPASTGHKYSLNFSVQALNIFNDINYGTPSGTVQPVWIPSATDPTVGITGPGNRFEANTHLAGGMFGSPSGAASRRIYVQAFFSF